MRKFFSTDTSFLIDLYIINTVTTADLRTQFRRVSAWIENGESVGIIKRGKPYAQLVPVRQKISKTPRKKIDFRAQAIKIWGKRKFSAQEVAQMRQAEHDNGF